MVKAATALFREPDDDTMMWRYMDLPKFVSLLDKRALFFTNVSILAQIDHFEGAFTRAHAVEWERRRSTAGNGSFFENVEEVDAFRDATYALQKGIRDSSYISCWHGNESDSLAMWKIYGVTGNSIAIQTRYRNLKATMPEWVGFGHVEYLDEHKDAIREGGLLEPLMTKRKPYEYEKEIRGVVWAGSGVVEEAHFIHNNALATGLLVPVTSMTKAFEKIYVNPASEGWFQDVVNGLVNRYDAQVPVVRSQLATGPIWR